MGCPACSALCLAVCGSTVIPQMGSMAVEVIDAAASADSASGYDDEAMRERKEILGPADSIIPSQPLPSLHQADSPDKSVEQRFSARAPTEPSRHVSSFRGCPPG